MLQNIHSVAYLEPFCKAVILFWVTRKNGNQDKTCSGEHERMLFLKGGSLLRGIYKIVFVFGKFHLGRGRHGAHVGDFHLTGMSIIAPSLFGTELLRSIGAY